MPHSLLAQAAEAEVTTSHPKCGLDPAPSLVDGLIYAIAPSITARHLSFLPFRFHLTMDALPSGVLQESGSRSALAVSSFRLRARLSFSIPFFSVRQRANTPQNWI
jgi:hypothetical protein